MSLFIDVDMIREVLLADGWETVYWRDGVSTFVLDSYEFVDADEYERYEARGSSHNPGLLLGGGAYESCGIPALGFGFQACRVVGYGSASDEPGHWIYGPISSIRAVMAWSEADVERRTEKLAKA